MAKRKSLRDRFHGDGKDADAEIYGLLKETVEMARATTGERGEAQALTARISALRTMAELVEKDDDRSAKERKAGAEDDDFTARIRELMKEGKTPEQVIEHMGMVMSAKKALVDPGRESLPAKEG